MTSDFNVRELILKDVITKHKTGNSSLSEWKTKALEYYSLMRFYQVNLLLIGISSISLILKRTSGRQNVYMTVFGLSAISGFYLYTLKESLYKELKKQSKIEDDDTFKEFIRFHRYALI